MLAYQPSFSLTFPNYSSTMQSGHHATNPNSLQNSSSDDLSPISPSQPPYQSHSSVMGSNISLPPLNLNPQNNASLPGLQSLDQRPMSPDTNASTASTITSPMRRHLHIRSEQRRRERITDGFANLRSIVPTIKSSNDSKATVLKKASEYIEALQYDVNELRNRLIIAERHLATMDTHTKQPQQQSSTAAVQHVSTHQNQLQSYPASNTLTSYPVQSQSLPASQTTHLIETNVPSSGYIYTVVPIQPTPTRQYATMQPQTHPPHPQTYHTPPPPPQQQNPVNHQQTQYYQFAGTTNPNPASGSSADGQPYYQYQTVQLQSVSPPRGYAYVLGATDKNKTKLPSINDL